jgi:hypothetical protein
VHNAHRATGPRYSGRHLREARPHGWHDPHPSRAGVPHGGRCHHSAERLRTGGQARPRNPSIWDVAYYLTGASGLADRRVAERDLLELYRKGLTARGVAARRLTSYGWRIDGTCCTDTCRCSYPMRASRSRSSCAWGSGGDRRVKTRVLLTCLALAAKGIGDETLRWRPSDHRAGRLIAARLAARRSG